MLHLRACALLVEPSLVVVELRPILTEPWLIDDLVVSELIAKVSRLILIEEASIAECDVRVPS